MAKNKKEIEDMRRRELDLQRRELLSTIRQSIMDESEAIKHLEDAQKTRKLIEETAQKVKQLQETLKPWADFIEQLTETAFEHGHAIATFKRITKSNGKNVVIGNKVLVMKAKTLRQLFVHGVPLGDLLFDDLPEIQVRLEETLKREGITTIGKTAKERRRMAIELREELDKEKLRKEGLKELKLLDDWINEQVSKAKPEQKEELRKHLHKKYEPQKQQIRKDYGLK